MNAVNEFWRPAVVLLLLFSLLAGAAFPLIVTGFAQVVFPYQANGSLIKSGDRTVGSELIGQPFDDPKYFWGRPSATSPFAYNAGASSGSNLGPTNPALVEAIQERIQKLHEVDPGNNSPVPVDLVTASAGGLDPHISPAAAEYQAVRVARAREMPIEQIRKLVAEHSEKRTFGILGEPRVNVLKLNLALDAAR